MQTFVFQDLSILWATFTPLKWMALDVNSVENPRDPHLDLKIFRCPSSLRGKRESRKEGSQYMQNMSYNQWALPKKAPGLPHTYLCCFLHIQPWASDSISFVPTGKGLWWHLTYQRPNQNGHHLTEEEIGTGSQENLVPGPPLLVTVRVTLGKLLYLS